MIMRNFLLFSLSISIFGLMTALSPSNDESGHIFKMDIEVAFAKMLQE